jgi:CRP/FNR family transcriptional regulator, cyclic AMP receptor protein
MDAGRLKSIDIFADLTDEQLERVGSVVKETSFSEGESIVRSGEFSEDLFVIEDGTVEIRREGEEIATLRAGDVVGETGTVERGLRNADATAASEVKALHVHRNQLKSLRRDVPELDERLTRLAEERTTS